MPLSVRTTSRVDTQEGAERMVRYERKYVAVDEKISEHGQIIPTAIHWHDGRVFPVDAVSDIRLAASQKVGGVGLRYTCSIRGQTKYLYMEAVSKWFLEVPIVCQVGQ